MELCADPKSLEGATWWLCYLSSPKHVDFYFSFGTVLLLLALVVPLALLLGSAGAFAKRSSFLPARMLGLGYTSMVRGIPDIIFFLFVPIAIDQGFEWVRHQFLCPADWGAVYRGNEFAVCAAAKLPLNTAHAWFHKSYGFFLAALSFAIVFGAFAANVIDGALQAVPRAQLETARAFGMTPKQILRRVHLPQMWIYALPGLSNLWMLLIKVTPLLFLLGVEDIVYYARELGSSKVKLYDYPHGDWRIYYFAGLLIFYLLLTSFSARFFNWLMAKMSKGQATLGGQAGGAAL